MESINTKIGDISENDVINMMNDTGELITRFNIDRLTSSAIAAQTSNALTNKVEFSKWMSRNYSKSGIFNTSQSMKQYISQGIGKEQWFTKQVQGKGYEWDWMVKQRGNIKNLFNRYDAGDVVNRAASDVTETNLFTGNSVEYQMKAYTSKTNPHLSSTPKDMVVVTNAEKVDVVRKNGYKNVQEFQDNNTIIKSRNDRVDQVKSGTVNASYDIVNVAGVMAQAGAVGCAIGMGVETLCSYKAWKAGNITGVEYLKEIFKAGGEGGVTSGATAGVMIPISATITALGMTSVVTIPVAFALGYGINKIVAPCFARGEYKKLLSKAKYYENLQCAYDDLIDSMEYSTNQYYKFVTHIYEQNNINKELNKKNVQANKKLKDLYDLI